MLNTPFADASVFSNPILNSSCDRIINLIEKFKPNDDEVDFAFYGEASEIFQGATGNSVNKVCFITGRLQIYRIILEKINDEFKNVKLSTFKNYSVITLDDLIIEVFKSDAVITTTTLNGVVCYDYSVGAQDDQPKDPDPRPGDAEFNNTIMPYEADLQP